MSNTDFALLDRWWTDRDPEALKQIAARYAGMVYATCRRVLGNATEAEDVAQECFETLAVTRLKPAAYLGPWLHRVATNRSLKRLYSEQHRKAREKAYAADCLRKEHEVVWDDIYGYVDEAIAGLPEKERVVVVAHFLDDQTHEAIAKALGVSRQTVTYRIGQGVERIRGALKGRGIPITGSALAVLFAANASEAAPASLVSGLGKLALAGPVGAVTSTGAGFVSALASMKVKAIVGLGVLLVLAGAVQFVRHEAHVPSPAGPSQYAGVVTPESESPEHQSPSASGDGATSPMKDASTDADVRAPSVPATVPAQPDQGTLAGSVSDEEGNPVPGAEICLFPLFPEGAGAMSYSSSRSSSGFDGSGAGDHEGENAPFAILELSMLAASQEHSGGPSFEGVSDKSGAYLLRNIPLTGEAVLRARVDGFCTTYSKFQLARENPPQNMVLARGIVIQGRVVNQAGTGIGDATVRVSSFSFAGSDSDGQGVTCVGGGPLGESYTTNEQGIFRLTLKRVGTMTLQVTSPSTGRAKFADLVADPNVPLELRMPAMATVSGKIVWDDGSPATGCAILWEDVVAGDVGTVLMQSRSVQSSEGVVGGGGSCGGLGGGFVGGGGRTEGDIRAVLVGEDGTFRITGVGPTECLRVSVTDTDGVPVTDHIEIGPLKPGQEYVWNYRIGKPAVVEGVVSGSTSGAPIPGAVVMCEKEEPGSRPFGRSARAITGSDGRYTLRIFSPGGTYRVLALYGRSGAIALPAAEEAYAAQVDIMTGGTAQTADLLLPEPCTRIFRIVDSEGHPVTDCTMEVHEKTDGRENMWSCSEHADSAGRIQLAGLAPDVDIECVFRSGENTGRSVLRRCQTGEVADEETVVLYGPAGVSGVICGEDGNVLADRKFELVVSWGDGVEKRFFPTTDSAGVFTLPDAVPATTVVCQFDVAEKDGAETRNLICVTQPISLSPRAVTDLGSVVVKGI